jgi:hypothetical protein
MLYPTQLRTIPPRGRSLISWTHKSQLISVPAPPLADTFAINIPPLDTRMDYPLVSSKPR